MKIFLLSNAFKGSLTSREANALFRKGLSFLPEVSFRSFAMADGGDGSLDALSSFRRGAFRKTVTMGPIKGSLVESEYYLSEEEAYLEERRTGGLSLLGTGSFRDTTSHGLGEQILLAKRDGARKVTLFLGGSASNDLGLGMMKALGMRFLDSDGREVFPTSGTLSRIVRYETGTLQEHVEGLSFTLVLDVFVPLLGEKGATFLFARQKGARTEDLPAYEKTFLRLVTLFETEQRRDWLRPGAGAAGGIAYAGFRFLDAGAHRGSEYFLSLSKVQDMVREGDVLVTGEGRIDRTSFEGKLLGCLKDLAKKSRLPLLAIGGSVATELLREKDKDVLYLPLSDGKRILSPEEILLSLRRMREILSSFLSRRKKIPV